MKAEKKAAEKEAKVKDQQQPNKDDDDACVADEESLDPNVSHVSVKFRLLDASLHFCF